MPPTKFQFIWLRGFPRRSLKMWKVNGRWTTDAMWWQKLTLPLAMQGELKKEKFTGIILSKSCITTYTRHYQNKNIETVPFLVWNWWNLTIFWEIHYVGLFVCLVVLNATFNNISVILWLSVLLVEDTGEPRKNHKPVICNWWTLSHNVVNTSHLTLYNNTVNVQGRWNSFSFTHDIYTVQSETKRDKSLW
jgi:hypothetical protein